MIFFFEGMLVPSAQEAGIKLPRNIESYRSEDYPHWHVYRMSQLGAPFSYPDIPLHNAKLIAGLSEEDVKTVTFDDLEKLGCIWE